jgi:hypothetical protein
MLHTVANATASRKPRKAYYAWLDDQHGILTQDPQGQMWFRNDETDDLIAITPEHCTFLTVNGEVGTCAVQHLADLRHGGYAVIACGRAQEVS